jgi:hypothetical protein
VRAACSAGRFCTVIGDISHAWLAASKCARSRRSAVGLWIRKLCQPRSGVRSWHRGSRWAVSILTSRRQWLHSIRLVWCAQGRRRCMRSLSL